MKYGKYMICRMYNRRGNQYQTVFFPPANDLMDSIHRLYRLSELKADHWTIWGILYVDEETYINAKIEESVKDFLDADRTEMQYREKLRRGEITFNCYSEVMQSLSDNKWTALRILSMQMKRAWGKDYSVNSELAHQLYNLYGM